MSVDETALSLPNDLRRLAFLPWSKWRFPAPRRITLPEPVILKRLATAFLVLIPLGRRIEVNFLSIAGGTSYARPILPFEIWGLAKFVPPRLEIVTKLNLLPSLELR